MFTINFSKFFLQTPPATDSEYESFPLQPSSVVQFSSAVRTLEDTLSNVRNRFPLIDLTNHIEKDLDILLIDFCSVLDQFSFVGNPDKT